MPASTAHRLPAGLLLGMLLLGHAAVPASAEPPAVEDIQPPALPGMESGSDTRLAWLETIWAQHLQWKVPTIETADVEAELSARDLLRFDPEHLQATRVLLRVGETNRVHAISGMAASWLDYLEGNSEGHTSAWPRVEQAMRAWRYNITEDQRITGSATFERRQLEIAQDGIRRQRWVGAENALRELIHVYPRHREGLRLLIEVFERQEEYAMAAMCAAYASRLYPEDAEFISEFVDGIARIGRVEEALRRFKSLHESQPEEPLFLAGYSQLLTRLERNKEAVKAVSEWVRLDSQNPEAWMYYANVLLKTGRLVFCKIALNKAIELDSERPQPYEFHARIALAEEAPEKAVYWLERLRRRMPADRFDLLLTTPPFSDHPPVVEAFSL